MIIYIIFKSKTINMIKAIYGTNNAQIDVTPIINRIMSENIDTFIVNNKLFTDIDCGKYKWLRIQSSGTKQIFAENRIVSVKSIINSLDNDNDNDNHDEKKTLILYVFNIWNENVEYFIKYGCFDDPNYKFVIVCNDMNLVFEYPKYVHVIHRENIGFDFGGWSVGLLTNNMYTQYDNFIFVNSSCIGLFVPKYCKKIWCDIFTENISSETKLFGTMINNNLHNNLSADPVNLAHVQSWIFSTDKIGLKILIDNGIFSIKKFTKTHIETINNKEVLMSRIIISNGFNIGSLMQIYENVDFRLGQALLENNKTVFYGDLAYSKAYFGETIHPYEFIFIKANRNISKEWINMYKNK